MYAIICMNLHVYETVEKPMIAIIDYNTRVGMNDTSSYNIFWIIMDSFGAIHDKLSGLGRVIV
jgi:hypothetical protein